MTKQQVADRISKKTKLSAEQSVAAVESFMQTVKDAFKAGESVYLRGFGTFYPKKQAEKVARNISKGIQIKIPARVVPGFKPSKEFRKGLV